MLREKALEKKVHDLELEAETKTNTKEDKARHIKLMEVRNDVKVTDTGIGALAQSCGTLVYLSEPQMSVVKLNACRQHSESIYH